MFIKRLTFFLFFLLTFLSIAGQSLENIGITIDEGSRVASFILDDSTSVSLQQYRPLFSFRLNGRYFESDDVPSGLTGSRFVMIFQGGVQAEFVSRGGSHPGWLSELILRNYGTDTVRISNVVPFGENSKDVYITGYGPSDLARARLFIPGKTPVRVILPDNAWEMGFSAFHISPDVSVCAIARRASVQNSVKKRYETVIPPGGSVSYNIYGDIYRGEWQDGLKMMFQQRYLYDLSAFDDTLYNRDDLKWIRKSYLIVLQMSWDRLYYDRFTSAEGFNSLIEKYNNIFGHLDVFGLWPTWPRLGLDNRNQWDMYRTLPGGLEKLRQYSRYARLNDCRFFIAYNPWDGSTRAENHLRGMASLIDQVEADGVVLDTRGKSGKEMQQAVDSVREGVIMYSEGMAVVKDMPGILSGRVHNAIFLSPELNLNKLIKPDFAIFRVGDVGEDILHREISVAFFNGYGMELNFFRPGGRGEELIKDMNYLARTTFLLRQNNDAFTDAEWTPLLPSAIDKAYVNRWQAGEKVVYSVLNMNHKGIDTLLFSMEAVSGKHLVSLWNHEELVPGKTAGRWFVPVKAAGWDKSLNGTRNESSVECIALLPQLLKAELKGTRLHLSTDREGVLRIYRGDPGYDKTPVSIATPADTVVDTDFLFGIMEGKIVVQLINNDLLLDERVVKLSGETPWKSGVTSKCVPASEIVPGMILVPAEEMKYRLSAHDMFIGYPNVDKEMITRADSFLIDRYPVTNEDFLRFLSETRYIPEDTVNYLKHWEKGLPVTGQERYPVVYISLEDARAYAKWAGKRLPTEVEWQLAAQGTDGRIWPWGNDFHATKCNNAFGRPTPVDAFPKGESPYGVADMVGNVWQMTDDVYCDGAYYFVIIRGGSYYKPDSSQWYLPGGPQPLNMTQMQLLVSPGFDRCSTVGFRCVKDFKTVTKTNLQTGAGN